MPDPTVPQLDSLPLFADPPGTRPARHPTSPQHPTRPRRRTPPPPPAPAPAASDTPATTLTDHRSRGSRIDWALVRAFRQQAADELATALRDREGLDEASRHELGRTIVGNLLADHTDQALTAGHATFTAEEQQRLADAIFDALFRLGRLQPLVDDPEVENIEIRGHDTVHLIYADGRIEKGPDVADSDEELLDAVAFLASRQERPFSPSAPRVNLNLPGGGRLAATGWITPRPYVAIRNHRLVLVTLADLVDRGVMDEVCASLLSAAALARCNIVISGLPGVGKTTTVRALCNELDPAESVGTIETEYELYLHQMGERHERVYAWEARPGGGERGPDGKLIGEVTLDDLLYDSFRYNLSRTIVGEVRGREILQLIKAMQAGSGTFSTTHAPTARAAIDRLATAAMEAGPHITAAYANRQLAMHLDLIVQIGMRDTLHGGVGRRQRYIADVIALELGEDDGLAVTDVYRRGPDSRGVPFSLPDTLRARLIQHGFDAAGFTAQQEAARWPR